MKGKKKHVEGGLKSEQCDSDLAKEEAVKVPEKKGSLEKDIEGLQAELQGQKDRYLYLLADFDNYKKRAIRERSDLMKYGNLDLIRSMLTAVDNFELLVDAASKTAVGDEGLIDGAKLAIKQFQDNLARWGVVPVDSLGKPFDPFIHEAIGSEVVADKEPNTVIKELQKAYKIHDKVLRPAKVIVSSQKSEKIGDKGEKNGE
ncbi:MAG: nucleotide exchange factor GrpE [Deltaproteobacteria bacterium RIFCSPHIGHO2_12_FULL_43_9]|nr:MAG: nucleotide exchange factor GrpE [Deltaproteobacteria bacterium RIFCSPHIGHO2_12_FULL_43_9]